jgi:Reverse transcriptase (RNA-dependent DNA polymerase)/RNase H-like domain found in reverse transcriptase/Retroviral aspartyl protease
MYVKDCGQKCTFLIDNGSDISIIKEEKLKDSQKLKPNSIVTIKGIAAGEMTTIGATTLTMLFEEKCGLEHEFLIVKRHIPFEFDGIIGIDFLTRYRCLIDYDKFLLNFKHEGLLLEIPLVEEIHIIPPRSEIICRLKVVINQASIILAEEIENGVFCANSIVEHTPYIRFMNTTMQTKIIKKFRPTIKKLSDYEVLNNQKVTENAKRKERLIEEIKLDNLSPDNAGVIEEICREFSDIFYLRGDSLTTNNFYTQNIELIDNAPVYVKNYRMPHTSKDEIQEQVKNMLSEDIIENSNSPFNAPILIVPKKGGKSRMVVDFRSLNKKLIGDKFPLPRIEEILDQLGRAKYFSVLDLKSGFYQIGLEETAKRATAFSTDSGHFQFKRLPMGLKISPNSFQRMMTIAMAGLPPDISFLYIDDLVVTGCSRDHHLKNLRLVFEKLRERNLKLNPEKCAFMQTEVTYLGHHISEEGIRPDPTKYDVIKNYPRPRNADEVRRFVALCNYYRRFVQNFATLAAPLNRLLRKNIAFEWSNECESSFEKLKQKLVEHEILKFPDFDIDFVLVTDASNVACGAVLAQRHGETNLPIAYASKAFTKGENKSTIEKELTAIHWGVDHFKPYLFGKRFKILTDHKPLIYLFSMKNPNSKLTGMTWDLKEFQYTVEYLPGKNNCVADALSRIEIDSERLKEMKNSIMRVTTRSRSKEIFEEDKPEIAEESDQLQAFEVISEKDLNKAKKLEFVFKETIREEIEETKEKVMIILKENGNLANNLKIALAQLDAVKFAQITHK